MHSRILVVAQPGRRPRLRPRRAGRSAALPDTVHLVSAAATRWAGTPSRCAWWCPPVPGCGCVPSRPRWCCPVRQRGPRSALRSRWPGNWRSTWNPRWWPPTPCTNRRGRRGRGRGRVRCASACRSAAAVRTRAAGRGHCASTSRTSHCCGTASSWAGAHRRRRLGRRGVHQRITLSGNNFRSSRYGAAELVMAWRGRWPPGGVAGCRPKATPPGRPRGPSPRSPRVRRCWCGIRLLLGDGQLAAGGARNVLAQDSSVAILVLNPTR